MSPYGLEQLCEDAIRRGGSRERRQPLNLKEVWAAVDRYIVTCLDQKRGVSLPNLCRIGWRVLRLRNKCSHKPYFQLSESFCRSGGVDAGKASGQPPIPERDLCQFEELNFSKVAIKFSSELTKDHAFTGWRLLARQLSDVISQGKSVSVEFSFGKLIAKEREVHFVFAADLYIAHGLEVPVGAADDLEYKSSATFSAMETGALQGLSLRGSGVHAQVPQSSSSSARPGDVKTRASTGSNIRDLDGLSSLKTAAVCESLSANTYEDAAQNFLSVAGSTGKSQQSTMNGWAYRPEGSADILTLCRPPNSSADLHSLDLHADHAANADQWRSADCAPLRMTPAATSCTPLSLGGASALSNPRAQAYEDAWNVQVTGLEALASEKVRERAVADNQIQQYLEEDASVEAQRRARRREHAAFLKQQIKMKELAQAAVKAEFQEFEKRKASAESSTVASTAEGKPSTGLTLRSGFEENVSVSGSVASTSRPPNVLRDALDEQVQAKQLRRKKLRAVEMRADACLIEADKEELECVQDFERGLKARERECLTGAWREEVRLKDIFKAIESESGKQPASARRSSIGTPRPHAWPHSARGVGRSDPHKALYGLDSIGAAASLALQSKTMPCA